MVHLHVVLDGRWFRTGKRRLLVAVQRLSVVIIETVGVDQGCTTLLYSWRLLPLSTVAKLPFLH